MLAIGVVVVIAAIAGSGGDSGGGGDTEQSTVDEGQDTSSRLFPGRPDAQREDQERQFGQPAQIGDYQATVASAGFQQSINEFESAGYIVGEVTIKNSGSGAKPYNTFDWKLQTPGGQVIDPSFSGTEQLGSGDIVGGGSASGKIIFEVKDQKGDFYIIYKPDPFDASRGVWKVTV